MTTADGVVRALEAVSALAELPFRVTVEREGRSEVLLDALGDRPATRTSEVRLSSASTARLAWADSSGSERRERAERVVGRLLRLEEENRLFVEELAERYEELSLLTSIGSTLASVLSLERAADEILAQLASASGASRAALWAWDEESGELARLASRGYDADAPGAPSAGEPDPVVSAAFREGRPVLSEEGEALLAVPMARASADAGPPLGVLVLAAPADGAPFRAGDREVAMAVAGQAAAAIENRRLVRESLRRERLSAELEVARELQLGLLPDPASVADLVDAAARCDPERSVGGDFYHLLRLPGGRLGVMLGDVSSHGVSAALVMARVLSAADIVARRGDGPAATLARLAAELARDLEAADMHLTLFYGVWSPDDRELRYASAGHAHAFLLSAGGETRRIGALDPPLGLEEERRLEERLVEVDPGATLLLFTDGLFEGLEGERSENERRVVAAAAAASADGAEAVVEAAFRISERERSARGDDRTALAVGLGPVGGRGAA